MASSDMNPLVTVVTGANRGIGLAIVQAIAASSTPHTLYAGSRAGKDLGLKAVSPKSAVHYVSLDISDPSSIASLADRIKRDGGHVDRLINNAGTNIDYESGMAVADKARQTLDINYRGTLEMCRAFLPLLANGGRIVNISSVASHLKSYDPSLVTRFRSCASIAEVDALAAEYEQSAQRGDPRQQGWSSPYCVSKACMTAMTAVLAKENPKFLINCCCPGWCDSDMGQKVGRPTKTNEEGAKIPLRLAFKDIGGVSGEFWENPSVSDKAEGRVAKW